MSKKELQRAGILARVKAEELRLTDAAELMKVCYRQAKRLWKRYQAGGAAKLKHGNAGRRSNRARAGKERAKILKLVEEKYTGFGPTLAAEHLASEDKKQIHPETLRRWMLQDGLWQRARKRKQHRSRRQRRDHFGELVQMDGSFHAWYDERAGHACLMNMVDDATSTVEARLRDAEGIFDAARLLRQWIERHGVPLALYTDWKNVYVREPTAKEQLHGKTPVTQFGRMCQKLDIRIIAANSPQAKGRVERANATLQDRLIKKMRRKKIRTHEAANEFLREHYLPDHNARFARRAASEADYHRKAPSAKELDHILRLESERSISNDWVVRYENRYLQLERAVDAPPRQAKVTVHESEDGRVEIEYRGKTWAHREIEAPARPAAQEARQRPPRPSGWTPPADHPWRAAAAR